MRDISGDDLLEAPYDHRLVEARWVAEWEREGLFRAVPDSSRPKFSLVLLPPSVSARLHLGHALQSIVQDVLARYRRMTGFDVLWLPGLDFALIATQRAVEKELAAEGLTKQQLGRAAFDERVRRWTDDNGSAIVGELRSLGASLDWPRLRFTMDEPSIRSVRTTFVRLWDAGLIYQDLRIVNWCASCSSVLSNRQLVRQPRDRSTFSLTVALRNRGTTAVVSTERPELLAAAVAVVADPAQFDIEPGERAVLPLTGEAVPVVLDGEACRQAKCDAFLLLSGHDAEHWRVGARHGLEPRVGLDEAGRVRAPGRPWLDGLTVPAARERVTADLESGGHLIDRDTRAGAVALCERCQGEVEPVASRQWFVSMESMAAEARAAHDLGRPAFHPARYGDDYRAWLDGLHDWCISRQVWLGPRVPVFTCVCGHQFAAVDDPDRCPRCASEDLTQETDVLDAWFSQAMWQSTALGWPDERDELAAYRPTSLTVGSRDALRLGLSRMVMVGTRLTGELPFRDVVVTGIVLRPDTRKMDSAKGTAIAPGPFIDSHGADALRGWAALSAMTGHNIAFDPGIVTGWRRTIISLWNAARLVVGAGAGDPDDGGEPVPQASDARADLYRRWIFSRLNRLITVTTEGLETFALHRSAQALLEFIRTDLCKRYLVAVKPQLRAGDERTRQDAVLVLDVLLRLLHPVLPFVTEELWHRLPGDRPMLERCDWPRAADFPADPAAEALLLDLLAAEERPSGPRGRRRRRSDARRDAGRAGAPPEATQRSALTSRDRIGEIPGPRTDRADQDEPVGIERGN
ncbi:class I tRNA ligase family protein [Dactylosporangium sp. NPDC051541]|uniref:class I tRNA ligase family protein n=1 Tax=Dactylosporangium sp. NPDC051541 TaxID=3363977 RepID=UPI0037BE1D45